MKAVWIFYDIVLDATILSLLKEISPGGYTRWPRLTGLWACATSVCETLR